MKKDSLHKSKPVVSAKNISAGAPASAYVYNCAGLSIATMTLNNINVAPPDGLAGISVPGSPPACLKLPLSSFVSTLGVPVSVIFEGFSQPSWSPQTIFAPQNLAGMYFWCYFNGFILTNQNGAMFYMYGQSAASMMATVGVSKKRLSDPQKISVALSDHQTISIAL